MFPPKPIPQGYYEDKVEEKNESHFGSPLARKGGYKWNKLVSTMWLKYAGFGFLRLEWLGPWSFRCPVGEAQRMLLGRKACFKFQPIQSPLLEESRAFSGTAPETWSANSTGSLFGTNTWRIFSFSTYIFVLLLLCVFFTVIWAYYPLPFWSECSTSWVVVAVVFSCTAYFLNMFLLMHNTLKGSV